MRARHASEPVCGSDSTFAFTATTSTHSFRRPVMSYATTSLFPVTPAAPHAFSIFAAPHSPRETHALFEDLMGIFKPTVPPTQTQRVLEPRENTKSLKRCRSAPSLKKSWRKLLGLQMPVEEPTFDFVTPSSSRPRSPPNRQDSMSSDESFSDEDFGILSGLPTVDVFPKEEDGSSTDGTLVDEEFGVVSLCYATFPKRANLRDDCADFEGKHKPRCFGRVALLYSGEYN